MLKGTDYIQFDAISIQMEYIFCRKKKEFDAKKTDIVIQLDSQGETFHIHSVMLRKYTKGI